MASKCDPASQLLTTPSSTKVKASTTLNKSKEFSPKNMLSLDLPDACWNSDQGLPQSVTLDLGRPCRVTEMRISFQGGFVGQECTLLALALPAGMGTSTSTCLSEGEGEGNGDEVLLECVPEDCNEEQCFLVSPPSPPLPPAAGALASAVSDMGSSGSGSDKGAVTGDCEHRRQVRDSLSQGRAFQYYRVVFDASTDFYGRITIYQLGLYGSECTTHTS